MGSSLAVPIWITSGTSHGLNMNETTFKKWNRYFYLWWGKLDLKSSQYSLWFFGGLGPVWYQGRLVIFSYFQCWYTHTHSSERAVITCGLYYYWELVITGADSECSANQSLGQRLGHLVLKPSTDRTWAVIQRLIWIVAITYINVINFHNNPL